MTDLNAARLVTDLRLMADAPIKLSYCARAREAADYIERLAASQPPADSMCWERADQATIDSEAYYVVLHNGHEWRDFDLAVMSGTMVAYRLRPEYVRGRPEWIAKIIRPLATGKGE